MDTLLRFKLELESMLSGALRNDQATAHGVFTGIDRDIQQTQRYMDQLGREIKIKIDTSAIAKANSEMSALTQTGAMAAGSLIAQGVGRGLDFARDQVTDVFQKGMQGGALQMQFNTMAGVAEGGKLFEDLTKFIADSPLGPELYKDATTMQSFGIATREILPDLKMLGDVSMGNAQRLEALTLAFAQTTSAGKLMGQDLLQYVNAGFNPLAEIAAHTGQKMGDLRDAMSEGKITVDMVRQAFVWATSEGGRFYHMLDNIAETPFGKYQAELGNIETAKMKLGMALMPEVGHFFDTLKPIIDELPENLKKLEPSIDHLVRGMGDLVKWTSTHTETIEKWVTVAKIAAEAWLAWKVGTVALTAVNWLWVQSIGAQQTATLAATGATNQENLALQEQAELVGALTGEYIGLTAAQYEYMTASERAAFAGIMTGPNAAAGLAVGRMATSGATTLASGLSGAMVPVMIGAFAIHALDQWMRVGKGGEKYKDMIGYENGEELSFFDLIGRNEAKRRFAELERNGYSEEEALQYARTGVNPKATKNGINYGFLSGMGFSPAAATNSSILAKYGVSTAAPNAPTLSTGDTDAITGGGRKQIIIHARFGDNMTNHFSSFEGGVEQVRADFERMFLSVLQSANAAM